MPNFLNKFSKTLPCGNFEEIFSEAKELATNQQVLDIHLPDQDYIDL